MAAMTKRLQERIERDFHEPGSAAAVTQLVDESSDLEQVQAAIVLWARGDLIKLRDVCRLAREDWSATAGSLSTTASRRRSTGR